MKRNSIYAVTLFAFCLMQIGFFVVGDIASADLEIRLPRKGGGPLPATRTTVQNISQTDECGRTISGTLTQYFQLYGGVYKLVREVIHEDIADRDTSTTTRDERRDYARDANGALLGVTGSETGTVYPYNGYTTTYSVNRSYTIEPGEVVKVALEEYQSQTTLPDPGGFIANFTEIIDWDWQGLLGFVVGDTSTMTNYNDGTLYTSVGRTYYGWSDGIVRPTLNKEYWRAGGPTSPNVEGVALTALTYDGTGKVNGGSRNIHFQSREVPYYRGSQTQEFRGMWCKTLIDSEAFEDRTYVTDPGTGEVTGCVASENQCAPTTYVYNADGQLVDVVPPFCVWIVYGSCYPGTATTEIAAQNLSVEGSETHKVSAADLESKELIKKVSGQMHLRTSIDARVLRPSEARP